MPSEDWIQNYTAARFLYDWQTLAAGLLALLAAVGTIWVTRHIANRQIAASREEADRVILATRAQTEATFKQTEATVRLEDLRKASEALAFHAMLEAAMARVLAEADGARKAYPQFFPEKEAGLRSPEALAVRQSITKGAFTELRSACVRQGGPLTGEFLDLESEIDNFALQYEEHSSPTAPAGRRLGKHAGLSEQLASIERKAAALRKKAFEAFG